MSDLVTCPAPLGMPRVGSPLVDPAWPKDRGVVYCIEADGTPSAFWSWDQSEPENPQMDLSDETGEQHAVSWCAEQVGLPRRGARLEAGDVAGDWVLRVGSRLFWFQAAPVDDGLSGISRHVPALTGIPATDEGRLRAVAVIVEHLIAKPSGAL